MVEGILMIIVQLQKAVATVATVATVGEEGGLERELEGSLPMASH